MHPFTRRLSTAGGLVRFLPTVCAVSKDRPRAPCRQPASPAGGQDLLFCLGGGAIWTIPRAAPIRSPAQGAQNV
jgi:hypothetical protein